MLRDRRVWCRRPQTSSPLLLMLLLLLLLGVAVVVLPLPLPLPLLLQKMAQGWGM